MGGPMLTPTHVAMVTPTLAPIRDPTDEGGEGGEVVLSVLGSCEKEKQGQVQGQQKGSGQRRKEWSYKSEVKGDGELPLVLWQQQHAAEGDRQQLLEGLVSQLELVNAVHEEAMHEPEVWRGSYPSKMLQGTLTHASRLVDGVRTVHEIMQAQRQLSGVLVDYHSWLPPEHGKAFVDCLHSITTCVGEVVRLLSLSLSCASLPSPSDAPGTLTYMHTYMYT
jgi:hypothetical protein